MLFDLVLTCGGRGHSQYRPKDRAGKAASVVSRLTDQQRMGRVTGPAGLAVHHVEAERGEIVGVGVDAHVFGFVEDLGVSSAFVAGFGAGKTGIALNAAQRKRAGAAAEFEALSSIKCFR